VFLDAGGLSAGQMQRITQELRHFESVFLESAPEPNTVRARVFDSSSSCLSQAIRSSAAAAALHHAGRYRDAQTWCLQAPRQVRERRHGRSARLHRGAGPGAPSSWALQIDEAVARAFGLEPRTCTRICHRSGQHRSRVPDRSCTEHAPRARIGRDITRLSGRAGSSVCCAPGRCGARSAALEQ
jgi:predicted PhzF superfamily epimerase YddE/YHI9